MKLLTSAVQVTYKFMKCVIFLFFFVILVLGPIGLFYENKPYIYIHYDARVT
jgi:Zn-dependent protease